MTGPFRLLRWCLLAFAAAMIPAAAQACTLCSCTASTTALSFGSYSPVTASPTDASASVSINCTGLVSLFGLVEIRASAGTSGTALQRTMEHNGSTLRYNLFANSARTEVLADGTGGTTTITTPLNGLLFFSTVAPVYARVPASQWVASGTYGDTVIITVQY
ncbi:Csu type fimbrial protein [Sphingomonas glaciei]|uniref:Spore coat U domain-containing protein n=1 Tax=Sphingomonas glaciei TaxID=2938948 RepID=A0ABY5MRS4_9SPHN|nr:spore coat protein U domain-containing protein [Sphingomonas glaciei]UUR06833.1 spore coat U domain-containing protein [Sphingomonas glaciei]